MVSMSELWNWFLYCYINIQCVLYCLLMHTYHLRRIFFLKSTPVLNFMFRNLSSYLDKLYVYMRRLLISTDIWNCRRNTSPKGKFHVSINNFPLLLSATFWYFCSQLSIYILWSITYCYFYPRRSITFIRNFLLLVSATFCNLYPQRSVTCIRNVLLLVSATFYYLYPQLSVTCIRNFL